MSAAEVALAESRLGELRDDNQRLRHELEAAQNACARLLHSPSDLVLLKCLVHEATEASAGGDGSQKHSGGANLMGQLRVEIQSIRDKIQDMKEVLVSVKMEAQKVNMACVELHVGMAQ